MYIYLAFKKVSFHINLIRKQIYIIQFWLIILLLDSLYLIYILLRIFLVILTIFKVHFSKWFKAITTFYITIKKPSKHISNARQNFFPLFIGLCLNNFTNLRNITNFLILYFTIEMAKKIISVNFLSRFVTTFVYSNLAHLIFQTFIMNFRFI